MVVHIAVAQQHATIGTILQTALVSLGIGLVLLMAGRYQRSMADLTPASGAPSTRRSRRVGGLVIIVLSVPFLATGVLCLLDVLLRAIR